MQHLRSSGMSNRFILEWYVKQLFIKVVGRTTFVTSGMSNSFYIEWYVKQFLKAICQTALR